jgi:hypothetical protein
MHSCGANSYDIQVIGYGEYYGRYAASNKLIMVYFMSQDKDWCHDTRGGTGEDYATKDGIAPKALKRIMNRLIEPYDSEKDPYILK